MAGEAVHWVYAGILFGMGAIAGSFLSTLAYRVPREMRLLTPPSSCPACGVRILRRDNLPIVGWLLLQGRCRFCRTSISPRYPLVELLTAILWAIEGWRLAGMHRNGLPGIALGCFELLFISAMVVTVLVDIDHLVILDEISIGGAVVSLLAACFLPVMHHAASQEEYQAYHPILHHFLSDAPSWQRSTAAAAAGMIVGLLLALGVYFVGNHAFRRRIEAAREEDPEVDSVLGLGDVKLMGCFGAFFGVQAVFFIFLIGAILASVGGVIMKLASGDSEGETGLTGLRRRWSNGESILPFGPFLAVAALAFLFVGDSSSEALDILFQQ